MKAKAPENLIGIAAVEARTGLNRQTIYRWVAKKKFPPGGMYGGSNRRLWPESVINTWVGKNFQQVEVA